MLVGSSDQSPADAVGVLATCPRSAGTIGSDPMIAGITPASGIAAPAPASTGRVTPFKNGSPQLVVIPGPHDARFGTAHALSHLQSNQ